MGHNGRPSPDPARSPDSTNGRSILSVASLWEIVTRVQIGKLSLPAPPSKYLPRHLAELDALVVAQSLEEKPPLLSCDSLLEPYGADLRWE